MASGRANVVCTNNANEMINRITIVLVKLWMGSDGRRGEERSGEISSYPGSGVAFLPL